MSVSINIYDVGDLVKIKATFTVDGTLTDPTTVKGKWKLGSGDTTEYIYGTDTELVRESAGVFHFNVSPVANGTYYYRFEGTGAAQGAEEGTFQVRQSNFS